MKRSVLLVTFAIGLSACGGNPEAEGKALAADYCTAIKNAQGDFSKAMALGEEWGKKAEKAGEKYGNDPAKAQALLSGYMQGIGECLPQ